MHGSDLPTGVFAHNDLMALGALSVFRQAGIRCPDDVSLVGYNNTPTMDQVDPPMTTVEYPGVAVGRTAGSLALGLINGRYIHASATLYAPTLQVRKSTAPPPSIRHARRRR